MPTVADVLRQYGGEYLQRFGTRMPAEHKKVLNALAACRTGRLGTVWYECEDCGQRHPMGRSCGNRHCPTCQQHLTKAWLEKQLARLLPCPYFLITFTVPAELRAFLRRHPEVTYPALFEASSGALKTLAADPKYVGSRRPGFFGVLHTWGRTLEYHPHVHYVVPGGGLSDDGTQWLPSRADFFVPVWALSTLFRAKFREAVKHAGLLDEVNPAVWQENWVVHSEAVGDGRTSLQYLAPYVFRVAISDRRIVCSDGGHVTFSYRRSGTNQWRTMTLDAMEFVRRFLQHVLPTGFQKVRHYGFLGANSAHAIPAVQWLVALYYGLTFVLRGRVPAEATPAKPAPACPSCGGPLRLLKVIPCRLRSFFDTS